MTLTDLREAAWPSTPTQLQLSASSGSDGGGIFVPADTTWSQILDYAAGDGGDWAFDFFRPGFPTSRDSAVRYATLHRCVTLIAGTIAQLVTRGAMQVVDRATGRRATGARARRALELLVESPDGVTPALQFVEDAMADYCLDGNALIVVHQPPTGGLAARLERMRPWGAESRPARDGTDVYRLTPIRGLGTEHVAARDLAHVRWPRLQRCGVRGGGRDAFAQAPVVALRPALDIGLQGDQYIREWFTRGARSRLHVDFPPPDGAQPLTPTQRRELVGWVQRYSRTRQPLVTFGGQSSRIDDTPADSEAERLRAFQVRDVSRVFGVPAPLLNEMVTEWGKGIAELAKLFYRFGARHHLDRLLAACELRLLDRGQRFAVDDTDLLRGDADQVQKLLMALQGDAQRPAVADRGELRHIAGLPADGGD